MKSNKLFVGLVYVLTAIALIATFTIAAVDILTGDSFSSVNTVANPSNALGGFDGLVASIGAGQWRGGESATWTLSDFTQAGTIESVKYSVRIGGTGWVNDHISIQFSNDSGTTWFTSQSAIQPAGLTTYGNYTVTASFPANQSITDFQVRVLYTQNQGPDSTTIDFDGVETYVTYAPPDTTAPSVTLNTPNDGAWVKSKDISFNFTPFDASGLQNCTLYINQTLNESNQTPIINGQPNVIDTVVGADGDYLWNVTCLDTKGNPGSAANAYTARVDTTAPQILLMDPPDDGVSLVSEPTFSYNVSDRRGIVSCDLVVDGTLKAEDSTVTKGVQQTFQDSLVNGDHSWYVNCTDASGFVGQSETWNISVQVPGPTIVTNSSSYEQGATVGYDGGNWQAGSNVSVSVQFPNGSIEIFYALTNGSGEINVSQDIGLDYPIGQYTVSAQQVNDTLLNASATFEVTKRPVTLLSIPASGVQGTTFTLHGIGFSQGGDINLTIDVEGGAQNVSIIVANSTGGFAFALETNTSHPLGQHNASAYDISYPNLNASASFTVTDRVPSLETNKPVYAANETVGILGRLFSQLATLVLQIYDTNTGAIGPQFPTTILANSTGGFSYDWVANNTCSGNYTLLAQDQNDTSLEANTTFTISNQGEEQYTQPAEGVLGNRVTAAVSAVNVSDGNTQNAGLSASFLDGYLEFSFFPGIPDNSTFNEINVTVEHQRTSSKVNAFQMYLIEGSQAAALTGTGCSGVPPDAMSRTTCDITSDIQDNVSKANNLRIRVNYTRSGGGGGDAEIDYAAANYGWVGDFLGCFEFGNSPVAPSVFSLTTNGPIILNAGSTKRMECNFTVSDGNGADEILGADATIFTGPSVHGSQDNNLSHYTNSSCTQIGVTQNSKEFSCTFPLLYYASNGTWACNATGRSIDGSDSSLVGFEVDPLYAIDVEQTLLDFGDLQTGQESATVNENVTNLGNQPVNVTVYGYGVTPGDGLSFGCVGEDIPIEQTRFSSSISDSYEQKLTLSSGLQHALVLPSQDGVMERRNTSYWQTKVPASLASTGLCEGTIVFHATAMG